MKDQNKQASSAAESNLHKLEVAPKTNPNFSLNRLEHDLRKLHGKWRVVEQEVTDRDVHINALEAKNTELRVHVQELQDYIDGRKREWDELNRSVSDYRNTIEGMSGDLEGHDKVVADIEEEKAALALRVLDLERDLSKWKGRYAEKNEFLDSMRDGVGTGNNAALEEEVERNRKELARLEAQVAKLREALGEKEAIETRLRDEFAQAAVELEEARENAANFEIRAAELEAVLLESEADKKATEAELEAQRELVHVLEKELSKKQQNLDILERSADRLSAIHCGIQELDFEIDDRWTRATDVLVDEVLASASDESEEILLRPEELLDSAPAEEVEHVLILDRGLNGEKTCYPLTAGTLTIGRSPENDICLSSKYISRVHARIQVDGPAVTVEDAGSTNGFSVNSVAVRKHTLAHGDELEFGNDIFRYLHRKQRK